MSSIVHRSAHIGRTILLLPIALLLGVAGLAAATPAWASSTPPWTLSVTPSATNGGSALSPNSAPDATTIYVKVALSNASTTKSTVMQTTTVNLTSADKKDVWATVTGDKSSLTATSGGGGGSYAFATGDGNHATFAVTLNGATGSDKLSATATGVTAGSSTFSITAGAPATLAVTATPTSNKGGCPSSVSTTPNCWINGAVVPITVTALDANSHPAAGAVTISSNSGDSIPSLPSGAYTFTGAEKNGQKTFNLTVNSCNSGCTGSAADKVTASLGTTAQALKSSLSLTVYAGTVSSFSVAPTTSSIQGGLIRPNATSNTTQLTAGTQELLAIVPDNSNGKQIKNYAGTVHLTSTDPLASLAANYMFTCSATGCSSSTQIDNGSHTLAVTLNTVGTETVTVADKAITTATGKFTATVNSATAPTSLNVGLVSSDVATNGDTIKVVVTPVNALGFPVLGYTGTVTLVTTDESSTGDKIQTSASHPFTSGDKGSYQASVILGGCNSDCITTPDSITASAPTVTINSVVVPALTSNTAKVYVGAGAVSKLVIAPPSSATVGQPAQFTVSPENSNGLPVDNYTGTVHFTSADTTAGLPSNYTFTPCSTTTTPTCATESHFSVTLNSAATVTVKDVTRGFSATSTQVKPTTSH